jgi:hypothetical protein
MAILWVIFWRKLKKKITFLYGHTLEGYSMGHFLKNKKKNFVTLMYAHMIWVILWRELKTKFV